MAPQIIAPEQLANTQISNSYRLGMDGIQFDFQSSYKKHSISYVGNDTLRFELRNNDQFWWDVNSGTGSERSQIASKTLFANKEPIDISFGFTLEPGAANTAKWLVLGQLHLAEWSGNLTGYSPPVEIGMSGEKMIVTVRYTGSDGKSASKIIYTDLNDIQRGHEYDIDIKTVMDPGGNGRVVVTRDGTVIADYSGAVGYVGQQKVFWGEGLYRDGAATETLAAEFSDLSIKSGSTVTMPAADVFIGAPKLVVDGVKGAAADGGRDVSLSGTAKAGTTVTVFNGDTKIGTAKVDANGNFKLDVKIPKGAETSLTTIATDATGRSGLESKPTLIEIGTGAEIGAKLKDFVAQGNVGSIVITDGSVITASSSIYSYLFKYGQDTLSKIQGSFSFYDTTSVTGKSYDRQDFHYDSKGTLLQFVRYTKGIETYREIKNADGSKHIIDKATAGQTTVSDIAISGLVTLSEQFDANGKLFVRNIKSEAGGSEQHIFDTKTGLETKYVIKAADGSRVEGNLQLKGRPFTSETYSYDKNGKMILQERFEADGTKIFSQSWKADGTKEAHFFDGVTGKETNFTVYAADGSRAETTLKPGQPNEILKIISYDAAGKVIAQTTGGTVPVMANPPPAITPVETPVVVQPKPVEPPSTATPQTVYAVDAKTGLKTGYTQTATDGAKTTVTFTAGQENKLLTKTVLFANGKTSLSETYDGAGTKTWMAVYGADGSHVNTQFGAKNAAYDTLTNVYNSSEKIVGTTQTKNGKLVFEMSIDAAGAKLAKSFAANGTATAIKTGADGKLLSSETFDAAGKKTWSAVYAADGSHVNTQTGIKSATHDTLANVYDASDKIVSTILSKDGKVVLETKLSEGTSQSHTYDGLWRETAATYTAADKFKDTFVFSYSGDSATITRTQQDHFQGNTKLWTDVTDATGNHLQTTYSAGVRLASHDGVGDTFVSGGKDTFVFAKGAGQDVIRNFTTTTASHDTIEFDHAGVTNFSQLHFAQVGNDTVVTFGTADSITLQNVAPTQLKADYFLFT